MAIFGSDFQIWYQLSIIVSHQRRNLAVYPIHLIKKLQKHAFHQHQGLRKARTSPRMRIVLFRFWLSSIDCQWVDIRLSRSNSSRVSSDAVSLDSLANHWHNTHLSLNYTLASIQLEVSLCLIRMNLHRSEKNLFSWIYLSTWILIELGSEIIKGYPSFCIAWMFWRLLNMILEVIHSKFLSL